jgi:hypothetical protein
MGLFLKIILAILVIALIAPFFIEGRDGKPLITLDELQQDPEALPRVADKVSDLLGDGGSQGGSKDRIYSWRDEQGRLHYSNVEPMQKTGIKAVEVDPDINVISSGDPEKSNAPLLPVPPSEDESASDSEPKMIRVYDPEAR